MFRSERPKSLPAEDEVVVLVDRAIDPYLVMFHEPSGYRAEQFRGLRNKLIAMNPDGESKTLVVTSAMKWEGKTITAVNLALAFTELERTPVLLVDADLRSPQIERSLNLNPAPGLADVLVERIPLEAALRDVRMRGLTLLGPGTRLAGPSELLTSGRIEELFRALKQRFRYVIIDTPPVLAATDASVIAGKADGALLTVRLERSTRHLSRQAIKTLQELGGNVLGVFVTEVRGSDPDVDPRYAATTAAEE
jgi:capsular exopolysaccharide synthesis family protein